MTHHDGQSELVSVIHDVRRRWRMKLALRGAALTAACLALVLIGSAIVLQWMRFTAESIFGFRVFLAAAAALLAYVFFVRPLMRRVSDEQVAMYLEEHEPSLEAAIISAVEAERAGLSKESPALVRKLVASAVEKCRGIEDGRRVERDLFRRYSGALGGVVAIAALIFLLGPAYMRHALSALLVISRSVEAAAPYRIEVTPGHSTIPRGADQPISAKLFGFQSDQAVLMIRKSQTAAFERVPLIRTEDKYEGTLFDVAAPIEYFVEAVGVRSPVYTIKVADMPYVQKLELEYHFPAYTGLQPRKIEDGGDIAVLRGTEIRVRAVTTMPASGGGVMIDDKTSVPLAVQADGSLAGSFVADHDGFYRVDLEASGGPRVAGSPKYSIDVLTDQPPTVSFTKPGRDTTASPIEEVFLEAKAEDDYGVKTLDLVYSVNGGAEKTVKLFNGATRMTNVSAGHTIYLEELNVKPGDSVSYYARVGDNDTVAGSQKALSDMYFVRVRALQKDFKKAESQGGGGGGGQQQENQVGKLSEQERQIIAATFNIQRDKKPSNGDKTKQSAVVVGLMQQRLKDSVNELLGNFAGRVGDQAERFKKITDFLKQSVPEMQTAEGKLKAGSTDQALPAEHKALEYLQKAEEEYELQVSANQQQGGGGGGGQQRMADELADLFDLEVDKMANQYETAQRASQAQADQKIDELAEKLKELARRQEQEAERQRRRALDQQQASGGSGGSGGNGGAGGNSGAQQRALADQVEEAARRLERLAREEERQDLADAARQMREAADAMRKAAAGGDGNASAQAQAALERLRETERKLQRGQTQRAERDIQQAKAQAEELERRQREISDAAKNLAGIGTSERAQQSRSINEKKDALESKLGELESQLDRASRDASAEEKAASRKLAEAAGVIRDNRLRDYVRYSRQMVSRGRNQAEVNAAENSISQGLEEVRRRIDAAGAALGMSGGNASAEDKQEKTLDRARRLARSAESLAERTRERAQQARNEQEQNGQNGKPGQNGKNGSQGQGKGQQGQQGQGGNQGQGQQGEGQGQGQGQGQAGGSQGSDGQRGDAGGGAWNNGGVDRGGAWNGGAAWGGWWDGRLSPEDVRQLRNDARQYSNDARDLRGQLRGQEIDPKELEGVMSALRELEDDRVYQNVSELMRLQTAVAEGLKRFEFALRRKVEGDANKAALSSADNVPTEFRPLVEQYYRSLGRSPR